MNVCCQNLSAWKYIKSTVMQKAAKNFIVDVRLKLEQYDNEHHILWSNF